MDNIIAYPDRPRPNGARRASRIDPVIAEIVDALVHYRGQAHRDLVCNHIASMRAGRSVDASDTLRRDIIVAFHEHLDAMAASRRTRPLLELPFGAGSHRWGLSPEGARLFEGHLATARRA
jgi:hypothetical protein